MTAIGGVCRIDLSRLGGDPWLPDRTGYQIKTAVYAPAGADVVFVVSAGQIVDYGGVNYVRAHGQHLGSIVIECSDPATIQRWVEAFRSGMLW